MNVDRPAWTRRPLAALSHRFEYFAPGEGMAMLLGAAVVLALILGFFVFASQVTSDSWVPVLVFINLVLVSLPICSWLSGKPRDKKLHRLLVLLLIVKLLMAGPRYYLSEEVYGGEGDAGRYWQAGDVFVENLRTNGTLSISPSELEGFPRETRSVGYLVGVLSVVFGTTYFGGFILFSWFSWLGLMLFLRAFQVAMPNAPPHLLTMLFFLPSILFWPSSLGKEPPMVFLIGLLTLGTARILSNSKVGWGVLWVGIGGIGALQIRPHLLLICAVALVLSTMARSSGSTAVKGILVRLMVVLLVIPLLSLGISGLDSMFGTGSTGITSALDSTVERTEVGGSAFESRPVRGPQDIPAAMLTVLYRPFFFEAQNVQVQIAALEGMLLLVLTLLSLRWIWQIGPAMYRSAFTAYCGAWVLCFIVAFSNLGNAGILARQRVQMFPILMLLVAAAHWYSTQHRDGDDDDEPNLERDRRSLEPNDPEATRPLMSTTP